MPYWLTYTESPGWLCLILPESSHSYKYKHRYFMVSFLTFFFSIECDLEWHMYSMLKKHSNWNVYNSTGPFKSPGTYRVYRGHRRETCLHCCIPSCLNAIKHSLFELKGNSHFSFQWNSSLYLSLHRPLHSSEVNVPVQLNRKETFPFRYPFFYFCSHLFAFVKKTFKLKWNQRFAWNCCQAFTCYFLSCVDTTMQRWEYFCVPCKNI